MGSTDAARRHVAEAGLAAAAFAHLTADAFLNLPFEALGPTKALLKRFFSTGPWGPADDEALSAAVGSGEGWWERRLDAEITLAYGWRDGRFRVLLTGGRAEDRPADLLAGFEGPVVPEATPNPRTMRFRTGPVHDGPSRWFESAGSAAGAGGDPRAARLFADFGEVESVLVGPDFVAVSLHRPGDWERLLGPVLEAVVDEFGDGDDSGGHDPQVGPPAAGGGRRTSGRTGTGRRRTRLEEAWADLGRLRPADPSDLAVLAGAAEGGDPFRRQVAANLLGEADPAVAAVHWRRLVDDPSRAVRRATLDAVVDAGREELRPLLERALGDRDGWVRWKALRGLVELGAGPSRSAIASLAGDPDFRVRLEAAGALRTGEAGR